MDRWRRGRLVLVRCGVRPGGGGAAWNLRARVFKIYIAVTLDLSKFSLLGFFWLVGVQVLG